MKKYFLRLILTELFVFIFLLTISKQAIADWEWQNPLPQGHHLESIWGSSSNDVFAVGDNGTILHCPNHQIMTER